MSAPQKSECPLAGGQIAEENTNVYIIAPTDQSVNSDKAFSILATQYDSAGQALASDQPGDTEPSVLPGSLGLDQAFGQRRSSDTFAARNRGAVETSDPTGAFRDAIAAAGIEPPLEIHPDGRLHRFSPTGKRNDDAGWYVLHLDGVPAGSFGNWRDGYSQCWCVRTEQELDPKERRALAMHFEVMRRKRDAEQRQRQAEAAAAAYLRWSAAVPGVDHPYLTTKAVRAHGVRISGGDLLVPLCDSAGHLHSLQAIRPDGSKRFMPGGRVKGLYHVLGYPSGKLAICEGYATGATIHEVTGHAVAVAFNAGNLLPVARALRGKFPCLTLVLCADDDWRTPGNPGLTAATEAARTVGGLLAVPKFDGLPRGDKDTDFNDLHRLAGVVEMSV